jgi:hypothetical protein
MEGIDRKSQPESLARYIRLAQKARHDYLELLDVVFLINPDSGLKWISILFKLGRYGIASRALVHLAVEFPALFGLMIVETVPASGRVVFRREDLSLILALRRVVGDPETKSYVSCLAKIWGRQDSEEYFRQRAPDALTVHAEIQLVGFYDLHASRTPFFRFIGVSKKSCYLCD